MNEATTLSGKPTLSLNDGYIATYGGGSDADTAGAGHSLGGFNSGTAPPLAPAPGAGMPRSLGSSRTTLPRLSANNAATALVKGNTL